MDARSARKPRWHPVPFSALGWTVGAIALGVAFWLFAQERAYWLSFLLLPTAGAVAFGLPTFVGARRTGSRAPLVHALVWELGFTIAAALVMNEFGDRNRPAKPGDLNMNTSETIRQRSSEFSPGHFDPAGSAHPIAGKRVRSWRRRSGCPSTDNVRVSTSME